MLGRAVRRTSRRCFADFLSHRLRMSDSKRLTMALSWVQSAKILWENDLASARVWATSMSLGTGRSRPLSRRQHLQERTRGAISSYL
jgi:hypothetical protein